MELNILFLSAGALLILALILIGSGVALYVNRQRKESERIAAEKRALVGERATAAIQGETAPAPQTGLPAAAAAPADSGQAAAGPPVDVLRVFRDPRDGHLSVETMGRRSGSIHAMTPAQAESFHSLLAELKAWSEQPPGEAAHAPETAPAVLPDDATSATPFADSLPKSIEIEDMLPFRRKNIPKLDKAPEAPKTIAAQIDAIVQQLLARSPFAGREVSLSEDHASRLQIIVDGQLYQAIDEVEDADMKALIRAAVKEWNDRNRIKPGA